MFGLCFVLLQRPGCYSEADLDKGHYRLGDFGRCISLEDPSADEGGIVWGNPGYRPPEVREGGAGLFIVENGIEDLVVEALKHRPQRE